MRSVCVANNSEFCHHHRHIKPLWTHRFAHLVRAKEREGEKEFECRKLNNRIILQDTPPNVHIELAVCAFAHVYCSIVLIQGVNMTFIVYSKWIWKSSEMFLWLWEKWGKWDASNGWKTTHTHAYNAKRAIKGQAVYWRHGYNCEFSRDCLFIYRFILVHYLINIRPI